MTEELVNHGLPAHTFPAHDIALCPCLLLRKLFNGSLFITVKQLGTALPWEHVGIFPCSTVLSLGSFLELNSHKRVILLSCRG